MYKVGGGKVLKCKMLTNEDLIPQDRSLDILEKLRKNIEDENASITIYPDVHYKNGARVINGMVFCSRNNILPACLGVENCGFTVGRITGNYTKEELEDSFEKYTRNPKDKKLFTEEEVLRKFEYYLTEDFNANQTLYNYLGFKDSDNLIKVAHRALDVHILHRAVHSLGNLGGGNHFFELHEITDCMSECDFEKGQYIYIIHSDSIAVGDYINLLFSNLSELDYLKGTWVGFKKRARMRLLQTLFFVKKGLFFSDFKNVIKLVYSQDDYRLIPVNSKTGRTLLFYHNLASVFGDINRDEIVKRWAGLSAVTYTKEISHPHDNISIEKINGEECVIQRNGVQKLHSDKYYVLPGAMGTDMFVLENTFNQEAFLSANHGTGRFSDKHIARELYSVEDTHNELTMRNIKLFRVGQGNIAEQNCKAFKNVNLVVQEMEKQNLGKAVAKAFPFAIIKG